MNKWLFLIILSFASPCFAATYYVEIGGDDTKTGLNDTTEAWAHHPWDVNAAGTALGTDLQPGDTVIMGDGTWEYTSLTEAAWTVDDSGSAGGGYITTQAAAGDTPILYISDTSDYPLIYSIGDINYIKFDGITIRRNSASFLDDADRTGIKVIDDGAGNNPSYWRIINCTVYNCTYGGIYFEDGDHIYIGDETRTTTATTIDYDNHVYNCGYYGIECSGAPSDGGDSYVYIYGNYVHDTDDSAANSYGILINSNPSSIAGLPKKGYCRYNYVSNIPNWTAYDSHGGTELYFEYNTAVNCGYGVKFGSGTQAGLTNTQDKKYIRYNIVKYESGNTVDDDLNAIVVVGSTVVTPDDIQIIGNQILFEDEDNPTGTNGIKVYQNMSSVLIAENEIDNCDAYGIWVGPTASVSLTAIRYNRITNNEDSGIYITGASLGGQADITANIVHAYYCFEQETTELAENVNLTNNTFYADSTVKLGSLPRCIIFSDDCIATGKTFTAARNIMYNNDFRYIDFDATGTVNGTVSCDYNWYYGSDTADGWEATSGTPQNWSEWQALYDTNGGNEDPVVTDLGGGDFTLQVTSPCIDASPTSNTLLSPDSTWPLNVITISSDEVGAYNYAVAARPVSMSGRAFTLQ